MIQKKKALTKHTKKATKRTKSLGAKQPNLQVPLLSRLVPKNKKTAIKALTLAIIVITIGGFIPLPYTFAKTVTIPFATENENTADMELGDSKILKEGSNGSKEVEIKSMLSIWGRLFGLQPHKQKDGTSTITIAPVNKVVANGTIKYQYMLCSDGSYRYYSEEEFKDDKVGFTSKSQDDCAANNNGSKVSLTNNKPSNNSTSSSSRPTSTSQPYSYEAEKIDREVAKLNWCNEEDKRIGDEYIGKVQQAQATDNTIEEFNAIVEPAYYKYTYQMKSLISSGCDVSLYPDYTRQ